MSSKYLPSIKFPNPYSAHHRLKQALIDAELGKDSINERQQNKSLQILPNRSRIEPNMNEV